jgi:hypothetical protein
MYLLEIAFPISRKDGVISKNRYGFHEVRGTWRCHVSLGFSKIPETEMTGVRELISRMHCPTNQRPVSPLLVRLAQTAANDPLSDVAGKHSAETIRKGEIPTGSRSWVTAQSFQSNTVNSLYSLLTSLPALTPIKLT